MSVELNCLEYAPVLFAMYIATKAPSMKCVFRSLRFHLGENEQKAFSYRFHTKTLENDENNWDCLCVNENKQLKCTVSKRRGNSRFYLEVNITP